MTVSEFESRYAARATNSTPNATKGRMNMLISQIATMPEAPEKTSGASASAAKSPGIRQAMPNNASDSVAPGLRKGRK